jgi:predicted nucleic acid-binding protein
MAFGIFAIVAGIIPCAGPHATGDAGELARRQDRLQRAEAAFDPLPFGGDSARAYGRIYAAVIATGRKAHGAGRSIC